MNGPYFRIVRGADRPGAKRLAYPGANWVVAVAEDGTEVDVSTAVSEARVLFKAGSIDVVEFVALAFHVVDPTLDQA